MQHNSFGVSFSTISFMEEVLGSKSGIIAFERTKDIVFHIRFDNGNEYVFVLIADYITSAAKVRELHIAFPEAQFIVLGGNWMRATDDAVAEAKSLGVEIMPLRSFIAALHKKDLP